MNNFLHNQTNEELLSNELLSTQKKDMTTRSAQQSTDRFTYGVGQGSSEQKELQTTVRIDTSEDDEIAQETSESG